MRDLFLRAVNMVQKGLLGDIKKITVGINGGPTSADRSPRSPRRRSSIGTSGSARRRRSTTSRSAATINFRWWYEYSGGKFTDWGAHHVDIATWAIGHDKQGMGPIEIDGTDAKHPVPFKDGYPTVDDCYNTSHDFAVKCKFANGIEMIVDQPQRQRHPLRGDQGPHLRQPRQDHRQADRREVGQGQVRTATTWSASTRASRSRATRTTSTAASARAGCPSPTSSATCRR